MNNIQKYFRKPTFGSQFSNQGASPFSLSAPALLVDPSSEQVLLDYLDQANGKSGQGIALNRNITDRTKYSDTATEDTNRREKKRSLAVPGYLSPGGARELSKSIAAMRTGSDAYNAAKQLLLRQDERVQNFENTETPINWKPLLGWLDMMSGGKSNSAAMYREPMSAEQRKMAALQLNQELAKEAANLGTLDTRYGRLIVNPTGDVTGSNVITGREVVTKQGEKTERETGTGGASEAQITAQVKMLEPTATAAAEFLSNARRLKELYPIVRNFNNLSKKQQLLESFYQEGPNALVGSEYSVYSPEEREFHKIKGQLGDTIAKLSQGRSISDFDIKRIYENLATGKNMTKESFARQFNLLLDKIADKYERQTIGYPLATQRLGKEFEKKDFSNAKFAIDAKEAAKPAGAWKKDTSKMSTEEKKAYLKELQEKNNGK